MTDMIQKVTARLATIGYSVTEGDATALLQSIYSAEQYIKHYCNIDEVPDCLEYVWVDIAAGNFLLCKQATGQLTSMQIEQVVKRIQDGDAMVEYAATTDREATFNAYLLKMQQGHKDELIAHRKMRW